MSDYSTLPPFPLPRLPIGSLRSQIFFRPRRFFLLFLPMRSLVLGYWDFDSLSFKIVQNFSVIISWQAALIANVHHICYKLSCMKYRCAFPLLTKLLSFRYIFEKRHTLNSLLTDTSIRQTPGVGSCRIYCYFSVSILSQDTHPLKRTTDTFETVNGHLRSVLLSENTSKIHQNSIP